MDSTSDLPEGYKEKYGFTVVPAHVIIGDKDYLDGVTISRDELIQELLHSKEKITTTQPSPLDFINAFKEALETHDEVLFLGVSSALSATFQNAAIAAKRVDKEKITWIDTRVVTQATVLMAIHASMRRNQGMELKTVVEEIQEIIPTIHLYFLVGDLIFLQRGGRIGKAKQVLGDLLNKKPLLYLDDGMINSLESVKGIEAGYERIDELITKHAEEYGNYAMAGLYGMDNPDFDKLAETIKNKLKPLNYLYNPLGPGVLCHVGPKVEGMTILKIPDAAVDMYKK